jgi:DNA replication protein DnaC
MINRLVASQSDHTLERALRKYCSPRLLVIDELGYLPLDKQGRDLFFQVISKRAETGSVILTTNKPFRDWGEIFQDNAVATAIAERLIENGELIKIEGSSYRVKKRKQQAQGLEGLQ